MKIIIMEGEKMILAIISILLILGLVKLLPFVIEAIGAIVGFLIEVFCDIVAFFEVIF